MNQSLVIREASPSDIPVIIHLAKRIWQSTYSDLLSEEQFNFMLVNMYKPEALLTQMTSGTNYFLVGHNLEPVGFFAIAPKANNSRVCRIEKLYFLSTVQGIGFGRKTIEYIEQLALRKGFPILELNVYRNNPALAFYRKMGFSIFEEVDITYYQFVLNDYVLRKTIDLID